MLFDVVSLHYQKLESISSRLEMIDVLTDLFRLSSPEEIRSLVYITQGMLAPPFASVEIGIAEKHAEAAIGIATGHEQKQVEAAYKKSGDMGLAAESLSGSTKLRRITSEELTVLQLHEAMLKIAGASGPGSQDHKIKTFASLIAKSSPLSSRYIARLAMGQLRLGVGDATILEALSKTSAGNRLLKPALESAYNICSDLGEVAYVLFSEGEKGIEKISVSLFKPIRPALAERLPTSAEIMERMGGRCAAEGKYDGMRAQVHLDRKNKKVAIFSRNLQVVTEMFPEIAEAALHELDAEKAIIEGEAITYDQNTGEFHPFQETATRKRKHGIEEKSRELPLRLFSFDLLYCNGKSYLHEPYAARREKLHSIIKGEGVIRTSEMSIVSSPDALDRIFNDAINEGLEGVMAKDLNAPYIAGARKFSWIKMKRSYRNKLEDSLDLVIVGYYLGRGQRAEFGFGGLLAAAYNDSDDTFETVTRIGTGFSDDLMKEFKRELDRVKVKSKPARVVSLVKPDFWVEPRFVVTVNADEITRSSLHACGMKSSEGDGAQGYALRFPRLVGEGFRHDKNPEDATTTTEVMELFAMQKKAKA